MKVFTQTWYRGNNYGSCLQAFALPYVIRSFGYDCKVLAYWPTKVDLWKLKFINHSIRATFEYKINEFAMKRSKNGTDQAVDNLRCFDEFRAKQMQITEHCSNWQEINRICGEDAVFVCGSDQIWNPYFYDPFYFLEFEKDKHKKIAYAPSFGVDEIPDYSKKRLIRAISSFEHLSVREPKGAEIVKELTGKNAQVVVDPTMLMNIEDWNRVSVPVDMPQKYLLCYFLSKNDAYFSIAKNLANQYGLVLKMLPMVASDFNREETIKEPIGPAEWIDLVRNASFVLTDSFHCSLFAIRYHRQFYVLQRFSSGDKRGQNSRIHSLLQLASLQDRLIVPGSENRFDLIQENRFVTSDALLNDVIEKSRNWLCDALKQCSESVTER